MATVYVDTTCALTTTTTAHGHKVHNGVLLGEHPSNAPKDGHLGTAIQVFTTINQQTFAGSRVCVVTATKTTSMTTSSQSSSCHSCGNSLVATFFGGGGAAPEGRVYILRHSHFVKTTQECGLVTLLFSVPQLTVKRLGQMNIPTIRSTMKPTKAVMGAVTTCSSSSSSSSSTKRRGQSDNSSRSSSNTLPPESFKWGGVHFTMETVCTAEMGSGTKLADVASGPGSIYKARFRGGALAASPVPCSSAVERTVVTVDGSEPKSSLYLMIGGPFRATAAAATVAAAAQTVAAATAQPVGEADAGNKHR